jgi:hypothetical protein
MNWAAISMAAASPSASNDVRKRYIDTLQAADGHILEPLG